MIIWGSLHSKFGGQACSPWYFLLGFPLWLRRGFGGVDGAFDTERDMGRKFLALLGHFGLEKNEGSIPCR